jgi:hypothetical protein
MDIVLLLKNAQGIGSPNHKVYEKYIELTFGNCFSVLFLTTIERLMIKQNYNLAYEFFFGIIFYLPDNVYATIFSNHKQAITDFNITVQQKRLRGFRVLSKKQEFLSLLNVLNKAYLKADILEILAAIAHRLSYHKINLDLVTECGNEKGEDIGTYFSICVLHEHERFLLLFEICDYMDEDFLTEERIEREEQQRKIEEINKKKEEERIKAIEEQRINENMLLKKENQLIKAFLLQEKQIEINNFSEMKAEEKALTKFLKHEDMQGNLEIKTITAEDLQVNRLCILEKKLEASSNLSMDAEDLQMRSFLEKQAQSEKNANKLLSAQELEMRAFLTQEVFLEDLSIKTLSMEGFLSKQKVVPPPHIIDEELIREHEIIASLYLICGSYFCIQCFRMLKRSSLFLRCTKCCDTAFLQPPAKHSSWTPARIPPNSICFSCSKVIVKGEIIRCVCCYIKSEFLKVNSDCAACCNPETIHWVDTYTGSKYEMVSCGFCEREVNYAYLVEVCATCHDEICLHCLRKNSYIGVSVCGGCHSRREVNPFRHGGRNSEKVKLPKLT